MTSTRPQWTSVAVIGAGTIGLSWAALFASRGVKVRISDPRDDLAEVVREAMPMLAASIPGADSADLLDRIEIAGSLAEAVADAELVQENGPERLDFKQQLFAEIADAAPEGAVLASSSSGIIASAIAAKLPDDVAARLLIAHPFNPPQVVPLVEIVPGERTAQPVVDAAMAFYESLGKTAVPIRKEVDGFVANRLQSAIMRESISLVLQGVVTAEELDTIMKTSLGNRYATVGPFESQHLGGGPGGIRHMMEHLGRRMAEKWDDLGKPELTDHAIDTISDQTEKAYGTGADAYRKRSGLRDRKQQAILGALRALDTK